MTTPVDSIQLSSKGILPFYRSPSGVAILVRYLEEHGMNSEKILAGSGVRLSDLDNPEYMITFEQEFQIIRKVARMAREPFAGLVIGRQYHVGVQGMVGAAAISSETFIDAIRTVFNYITLTLSYFKYTLKVRGNLAFLEMKELMDLQDARVFICERELVSIHRIASDLLNQPVYAKEIRLAYQKPEHSDLYEEIFKCPVFFDSGQYQIIFDSEALFRQLPMSNKLAKKIYEKECGELAESSKARETVVDMVKRLIMVHQDGIPEFGQLAASMRMSERTLRRRLVDEGTSYKKLAAEIRKNRAMDLLKSSSFSIDQISIMLGYKDLPNFYRAFKTWTGLSPGKYRNSIRNDSVCSF